MPRAPKARAAILAAARRIVATRGAGHLTFESLSEESGVTRGGITYHFPSKESLLKGLVEDDLVQWDAVSAAHAASAGSFASSSRASSEAGNEARSTENHDGGTLSVHSATLPTRS